MDIGQELRNLKSFSMEMSAKDRGLAIGNSELIRESHNSFVRQDPFEVEYDKSAGKEEDAFHFVSYLHYNGNLYELDGLQKGPICYGEANEETWLSLAREQIQNRIERYSDKEIRFNLMALIGDRKELAQKEVNRLKLIRNYIYEKVGSELHEQGFDYTEVQQEISQFAE